jgi:NhaP-type Na+/H+ or K+/H+ antiporter
MRTFIRILTCSIVGGASGALFGAVLFGISTYMGMDSPGYANDRVGWAALSAYIGAIMGLALGIIIGFAVGLIKPRTWSGALIGLAVGSLVDVYLISQGAYRDPQVRMLLVWPLLFGALVGLLAGKIAYVMRDRTRP